MKISPRHIEAWVARHFDYKRHTKGRQIRICNPFDNDDDYHFWIALFEDVSKNDPKKRPRYYVHDFRPGHGAHDGSFVQFVRKYHKKRYKKELSFFEAMSEITGKAPKDIRDELRKVRASAAQEENKEENIPDEEDITLPKGSKPLFDDTDSQARTMALNYLAGRKVSSDLVEKHKLHYTATSIVFPYYEYGILVYWQERETLNKVFMFPDEMSTGLGKTDFLYNFDNVEQPTECVVIVESIFNCIGIGDNCLASGGATVGGKQINKLRTLAPRTVVLSPDNDEAGRKSLRENYFLLKSDFRIAYCFPPTDFNDWNDLDKARGHGASRLYVEHHTRECNMRTIMRIG